MMCACRAFAAGREIMQVRDFSQFRIRMSPDLFVRVERSAKKNWRSKNAEIVMILEKHFAETQKETNEAQPGSTPSSVSHQ